MKKPVVDYRKLRFSNLSSPEFSHLKLLLGWAIYFTLYFLTENLIPEEACTPIHCWLDDVIPFNEYFAIFYCGWYVLIVASMGYFLLYDIPSFCSMQTFIFITQMAAMVIYILFPSRQDLRPAEFERNNVFTWLLGLIYSFDTSTGVCPSLHVAYSIGIASTWLKRKNTSKWFKCFIVVLCFFICISVAFVKQHSVLDIFAALPLGLLAEIWVFHDYWRERLTNKGSL